MENFKSMFKSWNSIVSVSTDPETGLLGLNPALPLFGCDLLSELVNCSASISSSLHGTIKGRVGVFIS